jgi:hypothetical protein
MSFFNFLWGQQYHGVVDSSLRQSQVGPMQDGLRDRFVGYGIICFARFCFDLLKNEYLLPDGVIGNTWAFGAHVPGSSPGRVALLLLLKKKQ